MEGNPGTSAWPQHPTSEKSGLALASLICGIGGLVTCGASSLVGVILGHLALSDIKKTGKEGRGLAIGGLVTSYLLTFIVGIAAVAGMAAPMILKQRQAAQRTEMISNMKRFGLALMEFEQEFGSYPSRATKDEVAEATGATIPIDGVQVLEQFEAYGLSDSPDLFSVPQSAHGNWVYYSYEGGSSDPSRPILVSPAVGRKRLVMKGDLSVEVVPNDVALPSSSGELEVISATQP